MYIYIYMYVCICNVCSDISEPGCYLRLPAAAETGFQRSGPWLQQKQSTRHRTSKYVRETCEAVLRTSGKLRRQPEEPCAAAPARTGAPRPRSLPVAPAASIIEMEG